MSADTQQMLTPATQSRDAAEGGDATVEGAAGRSHPGHVRSGNEDRLYVGEVVFAVADGMGGRRSGDVAADTALGPIADVDDARRPGDIEVVLRDAVLTANARVRSRGQAETVHEGMGTTVTAMAVEGERAHLAHVGDSRAYLLRDGELRQLTTDHSLVQRLVSAGVLSPTAASQHPDRHVITRAVGLQAHVDVDVAVTDLHVGDMLLLCTDGLTGVVDDATIAATLQSCHGVSEAADVLIDQALAAGGPDNVTALVVRIDEPND